jgi:hypothetical protein
VHRQPIRRFHLSFKPDKCSDDIST